MISAPRLEHKRKSKTTGNSVADLADTVIAVTPQGKRNRSFSLTGRKPVPNQEAFALTEKKRSKGENSYHKAPNTPIKKSQSDEDRIQREFYEIELGKYFSSKSEIAHTKTSNVFKVTEISSGKTFALKELNSAYFSKNKKLQKSALLEYKHAKLLQDHPNIVKYIKYWHYGPVIAFQMEYYMNGSLDIYLQDNPLHDPYTKTEKELLWFFLFDLLNGLCFIHKKKLIHGDIKPSNIFIYPRNNSTIPSLKIGDFGLSRFIGSNNTESFKKGDGQYLAPEFLDSKAEITPAVDIFSLGISLYEMATDYTASDALWNKVCQNEISFEKVSKELKVLLARMICRDPNLRVRAQDCLFTHDKFQHIATQLGREYVLDESSNEEMMDIESYSSLTEQENELGDDLMEEKRAVLDPVRKKLF